jgi:hypothetical protein
MLEDTIQLRQPSANYDYVRIEHIHDRRKRATYAVLKSGKTGLGRGITSFGCGYDLGSSKRPTRARRMQGSVVEGERSAGDPRLKTSKLATVAAPAGQFVLGCPRQRIVSPLAANTVWP